MCDDDSFDEMVLSRRGFGGMALGAGMALLPGCKASAPAKGADVAPPTPEGACDAYFVHPATGAAPAVLVCPDIFGLRPAFRQMGKRLAEAGYAVLTINPFYRVKHAPT